MYLGTEGCYLSINGRMQEQLLRYVFLAKWQSSHIALLSPWYIQACRHANIGIHAIPGTIYVLCF